MKNLLLIRVIGVIRGDILFGPRRRDARELPERRAETHAQVLPCLSADRFSFLSFRNNLFS
jgi:hypothetical protein